jgi:chromosome segregation ATPase
MTKANLQKELKEKVKEGIKPSHLKKLKRSKSVDDIPASPTQPLPLNRSKSQLEIPLQPSLKDQVLQLQDQVKFHSETAANYLSSLQTSQAKVNDLESQIKNNPPNQLLQDQLSEKQKSIENLTKKLEETNSELNAIKATNSNLLDDNLTLKHQGLKD